MLGQDGTARPARTLLEQHIRDRNMTLDEFAAYAEQYAREHGEPGTLGLRHLQRLVAGKREGNDGRPLGRLRPATVRLLERLTGERIDALLAAPATRPDSDDPAAELRQIHRTARRIDKTVLALLDNQLTAIRRLDRQLGAVAAYDETKRKAQQVSQFLSHSLAPGVREPLAALLSEICTLAGWQALDTGNITEAWKHYERGRTAAIESGSSAYQAHAEAEQAFVLLDINEATDAVQIIDTARCRAEKTAPSALRAWLAAANGEALAADGQRSASLHALAKAGTLLSLSNTGIERPYIALDEIHLARWRGHILTRIGHSDAVDVLTGALSQLDKTYTRAEAGLRVDLATALLASQRSDEACNHIAIAELLADQLGSRRQILRAQALRAVDGLPARKAGESSGGIQRE